MPSCYSNKYHFITWLITTILRSPFKIEERNIKLIIFMVNKFKWFNGLIFPDYLYRTINCGARCISYSSQSVMMTRHYLLTAEGIIVYDSQLKVTHRMLSVVFKPQTHIHSGIQTWGKQYHRGVIKQADLYVGILTVPD